MDREVQVANEWVIDFHEELGWEDRDKSFQALRSTLTALRDRLTPDEASNLAAQLPVVLRGIFYDGYKPSSLPEKNDDPEAFLNNIRERFNRQPVVDAEMLAKSTFRFLNKHISEGEMNDVKGMLPKDFAYLYDE
jgi:uncharacterized protein (DUF2267 family)